MTGSGIEVIEGNSLALRVATETGFTSTQLELIRNSAAKGCSEDEVAQLLIMARRTGLDPLARQIYMIKRWDAQARREVATPQTGIDGYRLTADRTGRYAPGREPSFSYDDAGNLWSATAYVKKLSGGMWHETAATALYREYVQTKKDGDPTATWAKMPHVMLSKCAEALALRRAFPAELSGVYTAEEMSQADNDAQGQGAAVVIEHVPDVAPTKCGCGALIQDHEYEDGRVMSAATIEEGTRARYGKVLCWDCAQKAKAEADKSAQGPQEESKQLGVVYHSGKPAPAKGAPVKDVIAHYTTGKAEPEQGSAAKALTSARSRFNVVAAYATSLGIKAPEHKASHNASQLEEMIRSLVATIIDAINATALMCEDIPTDAIPNDKATLEEWMAFVAAYDLMESIKEEVAGLELDDESEELEEELVN